MLKKSVRISRADGLEARTFAKLVQVASKYDSRIYMETETKRVNAKSIMGMMSLEPARDEMITISAEGADEADAVSEIEVFLTAAKNCISEYVKVKMSRGASPAHFFSGRSSRDEPVPGPYLTPRS